MNEFSNSFQIFNLNRYHINGHYTSHICMLSNRPWKAWKRTQRFWLSCAVVRPSKRPILRNRSPKRRLIPLSVCIFTKSKDWRKNQKSLSSVRIEIEYRSEIEIEIEFSNNIKRVSKFTQEDIILIENTDL